MFLGMRMASLHDKIKQASMICESTVIKGEHGLNDLNNNFKISLLSFIYNSTSKLIFYI